MESNRELIIWRVDSLILLFWPLLLLFSFYSLCIHSHLYRVSLLLLTLKISLCVCAKHYRFCYLSKLSFSNYRHNWLANRGQIEQTEIIETNQMMSTTSQQRRWTMHMFTVCLLFAKCRLHVQSLLLRFNERYIWKQCRTSVTIKIPMQIESLRTKQFWIFISFHFGCLSLSVRLFSFNFWHESQYCT